MIEMRWLVPVRGEKKLQYRQKIDVNIYAGNPFPGTSVYAGNPFPGTSFTPKWSEWRDVPLESEQDPSYP